MTSPSVLFSIRLVLAAVLALAGIAKLHDVRRFEVELVRLGAPAAFRVARLMPVLEVILAMGLLFGAGATITLALATSLFVAFTAVLTRDALHEKKEEKAGCNCFGPLIDLRRGWPAVIRSGTFAALSLFGVFFDRQPLGLGNLPAIAVGPVLLLAIVVFLGGPEIIFLRRRVADLEQRLDSVADSHGAETLSSEPALTGPALAAVDLVDLDGHRVKAATLRMESQPLVLLFADVRCSPCRTLLPQLALWERSHPDLRFVMIGRGKPEELRQWQRDYGLAHVYQQSTSDLRTRFGIAGTPAAVLIGPNGMVARPVAAGIAAISALVTGIRPPDPKMSREAAPVETLLEETLEETPPAASVASAQVLADLRFPTPSGQSAAVCNHGSREVLLLFWSEDCLYCDDLLERMRAARFGEDGVGPAIMMVAIGPFRPQRIARLPWPVVLDPTFKSLRALGVSGTPSALLVGPNCAPVAPLAIGAAAVAALVGVRS